MTPEKKITKACLDWLNRQSMSYFVKIHQGPMTSTVGISDILGLICGRFVAIEVKAPGNEPTPMQMRFLNLVLQAGGNAYWVTSLDDLKRKLADDQLIAVRGSLRAIDPKGEYTSAALESERSE